MNDTFRPDPLILDLFESLQSILPDASHAEREIALFEFSSSSQSDAIPLLFQLVDEELLDPTRTKNLLSIDTNVIPRIDNTALTKELQKVEQRIDAPVYSLKSGNRKTGQSTSSEQPAQRSVATSTSSSTQVLSFIIDLLFVCMVGGLGLFFIGLYSRPDLQLQLLSLEPLSFEDIRLLQSLTLISLPIGAIAYHLSLYLAVGRTVGESLTGTFLGNHRNARATRSAKVFRSLLSPLLLTVLGALPFFKGRSVLDHISNTSLSRFS